MAVTEIKKFLLITLLAILTSCSTREKDVLYQNATLQSLMAGNYYGNLSIKELKKYGDTGIGTFDKLNGEMIMLEGKVYAAISDGSAVEAGDAETTPFCDVTYFEKDYELSLSNISSIEELRSLLNNQIQIYGPNYFYIAVLTGEFTSIRTRSKRAISALKSGYEN